MFEKIKEELRSNSSGIRKNSHAIQKNTDEIQKHTHEIQKNSDEIRKHAHEIQKSSQNIHRLGVLMEHMNGKIDTALEVSVLVTNHNFSIRDHDERLNRVEDDIQVIKGVLTRSKK